MHTHTHTRAASLLRCSKAGKLRLGLPNKEYSQAPAPTTHRLTTSRGDGTVTGAPRTWGKQPVPLSTIVSNAAESFSPEAQPGGDGGQGPQAEGPARATGRQDTWVP